jgi:hypothetical protein
MCFVHSVFTKYSKYPSLTLTMPYLPPRHWTAQTSLPHNERTPRAETGSESRVERGSRRIDSYKHQPLKQSLKTPNYNLPSKFVKLLRRLIGLTSVSPPSCVLNTNCTNGRINYRAVVSKRPSNIYIYLHLKALP